MKHTQGTVNIETIGDQLWFVWLANYIGNNTGDCQVYNVTGEGGFPYLCKSENSVEITDSVAELCGFSKVKYGCIISVEDSNQCYITALINKVKSVLGKCPHDSCKGIKK